MSTNQVSAVPNSIPQTVRPTANFSTSSWGNYFLECDSVFKEIDITVQEQHEKLKEEVRRMIKATDMPARKLHLINAVKRLGVAYHFEREINDTLKKMYHGCDNDDNDLYTVSLRFRLLRQQGISISCDVFEKFKDDEGKFKACLINDAQSILSLYEAAHLAIRGEDILDEALAFTTTHLKSMVTHVNPNLVEQINHALYRPLHKALPRLEARYFLDIYPKDDSHDQTLLKFAKLDFNIVQAMHQKEISGLTEWWKDLDFTQKLPFARDRLVELYFWALGMYFEPQYSLSRRMMTKVICMYTLLDDTFDAYGTLEELKLFAEAVKRWNISAIDMLPEYMKLIYKTLLDVFCEIEEEMAKERYCMHYPKNEMKRVIQAYLSEAFWFNDGYVPTMEEYIPVAILSSYGCQITAISCMGEIATEEAFDCLSNNLKIVRVSSIIGRLMNDISSHKFEQKRGHVASAIECYMKQHGVSEEDAVEVLCQDTANAWKDINEDFLKPTAVPLPLLEPCLNFARVIDFLYKQDEDRCTDSYLIKDQIRSILKDPVTL